MFTVKVVFDDGREVYFRDLPFSKCLLKARSAASFVPVREVLITLNPVKQTELIKEKK